MGDAQGRRVGVDPVSDHPVVHGAARRDLIAGQQTHDPGVPVVELRQERTGERFQRGDGAPWWPGGSTGGLTDGMALKRWVMKEAPCWTASSA